MLLILMFILLTFCMVPYARNNETCCVPYLQSNSLKESEWDHAFQNFFGRLEYYAKLY